MCPEVVLDKDKCMQYEEMLQTAKELPAMLDDESERDEGFIAEEAAAGAAAVEEERGNALMEPQSKRAPVFPEDEPFIDFDAAYDEQCRGQQKEEEEHYPDFEAAYTAHEEMCRANKRAAELDAVDTSFFDGRAETPENPIVCSYEVGPPKRARAGFLSRLTTHRRWETSSPKDEAAVFESFSYEPQEPKPELVQAPTRFFTTAVLTVPDTLKSASFDQEFVSSFLADQPEIDTSLVVAGTLAIEQRQRTPTLALQFASSLVEGGLENVSQMRVAASLSEQIGAVEQAVHILERVLRLRPEEPQSYRDLALLLLRRSETGNNKTTERALGLLNTVVERQWDKRFHQIEVVALMDLNAVLRAVEAKGLGAFVTHGVFSEFLTHFLDVDLRVVLTWDRDACDVDLHVTEPSGERCTPFSNQTGSRGVMSRDFTEGYGPIEYLARSAGKGKYSVAACLRSLPPGSKSVVATVHVYVDYGRQNQKVFVNSVVLTTLGADVAFGDVTFEEDTAMDVTRDE